MVATKKTFNLPERGKGFLSGKASFVSRNVWRGNSNKAARYKGGGKEQARMVGSRNWNVIGNLKSKSPSGFGGKLSDGPGSATDATAKSGVGYKGNLTPLVQLYKDVDRKARVVTVPYVSSADVSATTFTSAYASGTRLTDQEIDPIKSSTYLPPNQTGLAYKPNSENNGSSAPKDATSKKLSSLPSGPATYSGTVSVTPETQRTLHNLKYGTDGDPNPRLGLPAINPVDQQGYQPEQLEANEKWIYDRYTEGKHFVEESNEEMLEKSGKMDYEDEEGASHDSRGLVGTAVNNYLWSMKRNHRFMPNVKPRAPSTQPKIKKVY